MDTGEGGVKLQAIEAMDAPGNFLNVNLIPEFDGSSHTVAEWLRKAESACQLCGITDVARAIGLRLTGGAFEVFDQMAPEEQGNLEKVKERLLAAFAPDPLRDQFHVDEVSRSVHSLDSM